MSINIRKATVRGALLFLLTVDHVPVAWMTRESLDECLEALCG